MMKHFSQHLTGRMFAGLWCAAFLSGCMPAGYYAPPPRGPVGQMPPQTFSAPTPVPNTNPLDLPPHPAASSLNDVPSVPAQDVLKIPPTTKTNTWHEVRPGETLPLIGKKYGVSVEAIQRANFLQRDVAVQPGTQLLIPSNGNSASGNSARNGN